MKGSAYKPSNKFELNEYAMRSRIAITMFESVKCAINSDSRRNYFCDRSQIQLKRVQELTFANFRRHYRTTAFKATRARFGH